MSKPKNNWRAYRHSDYLKKEDFLEEEILTVEEAREEEVAAPGQEPEFKLVLYFQEKEKGLVCNPTNCETMEELTGESDPNKWVGTRVEVYNDKKVKFAGVQIGGLRIRKPSVPLMKMRPHRSVSMMQPKSAVPNEPSLDEVNDELAEASSIPF